MSTETHLLIQTLSHRHADNHYSAFDYAKLVSDISITGFRFSGFLHSIVKPSKPGWEMVSLATPEIVHLFNVYDELFVVIVAEITTKSNIHMFYHKYIKVLRQIYRKL